MSAPGPVRWDVLTIGAGEPCGHIVLQPRDPVSAEDLLSAAEAIASFPALVEALEEMVQLFPEEGAANHEAYLCHSMLCHEARGIGDCDCGLRKLLAAREKARSLLASLHQESGSSKPTDRAIREAMHKEGEWP